MEGQDFIAMVDFAHTPNALKRALEAGRKMIAPGKRLIAVFGSAGLRDVHKRRLMAETSADSADLTILTAEDPRTESLDDILDMMAKGCEAKGGVEWETFHSCARSWRSDLPGVSNCVCRRPGNGLWKRARTEHVLWYHRVSLG